MKTITEQLTDELDWLASYGASSDRLGCPPTLGKLAQAEGDTRSRGLIVRKFFWTELGLISSPVEFKGREYEVETAVQAWVINLDLKDTGFDVTYRRQQALVILGFWNRTPEWWRKGPEWEFFYILAEHIVDGNS
jgi:hypothetical protein